MIIKFCIWISKYLPSFTISKDGVKYLTRHYLFLKDRLFCNIFLHHFHSSDQDIGIEGHGLLHNHPFDWSFSLILSGGYWEERRGLNGIVTKRLVKPFTINFISKKDFHRVDLVNEKDGAWTIFFTGSRKNNTWGFWDRISGEYIDFKDIEGAIE